MTTQIAYDANYRVKYSDTNRSYDDNGYLRVKDCVLTAEEVSDYYGREIGGWQQLKLNPDELYGILRPLEEIQKSVDTYNTLPLTDNHVMITPQNPHRERYFGATGSTAYIRDGELINDVVVWVGKGIDEIEAATKDSGKGRKDLSCGYTYDLVQESGEFNGKHYQFKMINIKANHVALVKEARVEGAGIADQKPITRKKSMFNTKLVKALKGLFASDGKAKDSDKEHLSEVAKGIVSMARDADYEGKEDKLLDEVAGILSELRGVQNAEKQAAGDNEPDEEAKKKAAADEEAAKKAKEAEDNETKEKEKTEAADAAVKSYGEVVALGTKILGRINPDMLQDSKPDDLATKILKVKNVSADGKSFNDKLVLLRGIAEQQQARRIPSSANDSRTTQSAKPAASGTMYNPMNRKA